MCFLDAIYFYLASCECNFLCVPRFNQKRVYGQSRPKSAPAFRPKFCDLDKKVLRFFAHFDETVGDDFRRRLVHILYYLIDDTIMIVEPRTKVRKLWSHFMRRNNPFSSWNCTYFALEFGFISRSSAEKASSPSSRHHIR